MEKMNYCIISKVTTQWPRSTKEEIVYSLHNADGRFVMPVEQLSKLLAELISCQFVTRLEISGSGPLIVSHLALDIEGRDSVVSTLSRYCTCAESLQIQLDDLNQSRPLPQIRVPISQEGWQPCSGISSSEL